MTTPDLDPTLVEQAARRSHPGLWRNRNKSPEYTMAWEHHLSVVHAALTGALRAEGAACSCGGSGLYPNEVPGVGTEWVSCPDCNRAEIEAIAYQRGKVEGARQVRAAVEAAAPRVNFEMRHDGTEDPPLVRALVEGHHDSWVAAREAVARIEAGAGMSAEQRAAEVLGKHERVTGIPTPKQRMVEALALGALIQWAGAEADLDDCRDAAAHVAAVLAEAGLLADSRPMLGGQKVLSIYCERDHEDEHDITCLLTAGLAEAERRGAVAALREAADEYAKGQGYQRMVVIDPEDREQVERLAGLLVDLQGEREHASVWWTDLADALRKFVNPTPPKPDEPTGLGAVVEDAEGNVWVNTGRDPKWLGREIGGAVDWHEVPAVRVLSEGVIP